MLTIGDSRVANLNYRYRIRNKKHVDDISPQCLSLRSRAVTDDRNEVNSHRVIDPPWAWVDVFNRRGATYVLRFLVYLPGRSALLISGQLRSLGILWALSRAAASVPTVPPNPKSIIRRSSHSLPPSHLPPLFNQHPACFGRRRSRPQPKPRKVASKYRMATTNQNRR